jgi:hypothetical protein
MLFAAFRAVHIVLHCFVCRYGDTDLPVVNIKGEILYKAWRDIFIDQRLENRYYSTVQYSTVKNTTTVRILILL